MYLNRAAAAGCACGLLAHLLPWTPPKSIKMTNGGCDNCGAQIKAGISSCRRRKTLLAAFHHQLAQADAAGLPNSVSSAGVCFICVGHVCQLVC